MATNYTKTPYKVQKRGGTKKYGVMAGTFEELKAEGCKHLGLQSYEIGITLGDNTIVDTGYFQSLKPDTLLIFESKHSEDIVNDLIEAHIACGGLLPDTLNNCLERHSNSGIAKPIQSFFNHMEEARRYDNKAEARRDDAKWFEGVEKQFKTKSQYMRFKAKRRTRKYFNDTKEKLLPRDSNNDTASNDKTSRDKHLKIRQQKERVIEEFKRKLQKNNFYEDRFDRFANGEQKLCKKNGEFDCQGAHNKEICGFKHHINPYLRKEYLIEFSSWNLDHQIEKGREVLPQLEKAVEDPSRKVNWVYFYDLLFTMENLKLVHTVCHDKKDHQLRVDMTKVFLPV